MLEEELSERNVGGGTLQKGMLEEGPSERNVGGWTFRKKCWRTLLEKNRKTALSRVISEAVPVIDTYRTFLH